MRKLGLNIFLVLFLLLHISAVPVQAMEDMNIMGEYISGGHLVDGGDYADRNPYMGYTIVDATRDDEAIGNDEISTDFSKYYEGMMGYGEELPIPEYSFTIELAEGHSLLQPDSGEGNSFYAYKTLDTGERIDGQLVLEPVMQSVKCRYSPSTDHDLMVNFLINATYQYSVRYDYWSETAQNTVSETEEGTINLSFDNYVTYWSSESGRTNLSFMEEKYPLEISEKDAIFYPEETMLNEENISMSTENSGIQGYLTLMPLVVRDASFVAVGMIDDTAMMEPDGMDPNMINPDRMEEEDLSSTTIAALWVAVSAAGAAVVAAGASGMMASASKSTSTVVSEMASAKEDVVSEDENTGTTDWSDNLTDWLKEKGSGFELVINEGVDLPEMLCKEGNVIEIPVRVDGGENGNWLFIAGSICGKENKKRIKTAVIPYGGGRGMITITLQGDEVVKKETIFCTVAALDADTMQVRDLGTCDFELVLEEEKEKQE